MMMKGDAMLRTSNGSPHLIPAALCCPADPGQSAREAELKRAARPSDSRSTSSPLQQTTSTDPTDTKVSS